MHNTLKSIILSSILACNAVMGVAQQANVFEQMKANPMKSILSAKPHTTTYTDAL